MRRDSAFPGLLDDNTDTPDGGKSGCDKDRKSDNDRKNPKTKQNRQKEAERNRQIRREKEAHAAAYKWWQTAKQEVHEEDHDILKQKLELQRELVERQKELAHLKQTETDQKRREEREEERSKRDEENARLRDICRLSLEQDRLQARRDRRANRLAKYDGATSATEATSSGDKSKARLQKMTTVSLGKAPLDEAEDDVARTPSPDEPFFLTEEQVDTLPWHHVQLYQLYGRHADDYLHPKIEQKVERGINPRLVHHMKKQRNQHDSRPDAAGLWLALREDSNSKLLKEDSTISRELKIPDLKLLLDQTTVRRAHSTKYKLGMMYRSSHNNEDRAKILAYNNPIPDLNDLAGDESIDRYLPSWTDFDLDNKSELSYKKWLRKIPEDEEAVENDNFDQTSAPSSVRSCRLLDEWSFMDAKPRKPVEKGPKLHFITEKDTTVKGEFSKRQKELLESRGIHPASDTRFHNNQLENDDSQRGSNPHSGSQSAPVSCRPAPLWQATPWQPLSLGALMEYKDRMGTSLGDGEHQLGRSRVWSAVTTYD